MSRVRRFIRRHATALAIIVVTACFMAAMGAVALEAAHRQDAFCAAIRDNRKGIQALIDVALEGEGQPSGRVRNLDAIPEFQAVDPEVQALIRVLVNPPAPPEGQEDPNGPSLVERLRTYRDTLDVEGCT